MCVFVYVYISRCVLEFVHTRIYIHTYTDRCTYEKVFIKYPQKNTTRIKDAVKVLFDTVVKLGETRITNLVSTPEGLLNAVAPLPIT